MTVTAAPVELGTPSTTAPANVGTPSTTAPVQLHVPPHSLVVVAGLPGAGKTTLVRRLAGRSSVLALDSEDVARALAGVPLPYRLLRPLVHATHLARVVAALWSGRSRVLTSDPLTSPLRRRLLRTAARLSGRRLVVVLLQASPEQARDGQSCRGRRLSTRRTTRHEVRYVQWLATAGDVDLALSREQAATAVLAAEHPADAPAA
jgi:predicted kinase